MTATPILSPIKFCKKCQCETARYKNGKCKPCANIRSAEWRLKNPGLGAIYFNAWIEKNKDKATAAGKSWRVENKEKMDASRKRWYDKNRDKKRQSDLNWYAENKDKASAKNAKWRKENKDKVRAGWQNRKAKKLAYGGKLTPGLSAKLFALQRGKCACCGEPLGENYHMDHVMPLALGGPNTDDNMQLLRKICNLQKHTKHPIDFMQSRGFLL